MENLEKNINEKLNKIKQMIENNENRDKIEKERKDLDKMLEIYLNDT